MNRTSQGFSFLELMAALVILGLLIAVGVPLVNNAILKGRISNTEQNIRVLKNAITQFHMDVGAYPSKLKDLVQRPTEEKLKTKWRMAYLDEVPVDGFKNDFVYRPVPGDPKTPFELYSHGENGPGSPKEERIGTYKK